MEIGFLFGAGAEVGYGLPSGGKFALDIFRQDIQPSKEAFKKMRESIDSRTSYATNWLPDDYQSKNIGSYGKSVFETIIKDTIEHNRDKIIEQVNNFDLIAENEIEIINAEFNQDVKKIIEEKIETTIDNINLAQRIKYTDEFKEGDKIFCNNYLAALLEIYEENKLAQEGHKQELRKILLSIFQLQVGALSENLTRKISDNLFQKNELELDIFDDIGDCFTINYQSTGINGLEYVTEKRDKKAINSDDDAIIILATNIIESIYASVLDYKSLIDSNWHYLYCPREEWAKFCKISIFLLTVQNYMVNCFQGLKSPGNGYYDDLKKALSQDFDSKMIATTNYNTLAKDIIEKEIVYLNGAIDIFYDPYLNQLDLEENFAKKPENHFIVPLMFTQSGTKPMTSIDMSIKYVEMYQKFKEADAICIIGFGFNKDDEHINGILRTLIDRDEKRIIIIDVDDTRTEINKQKEIAKKLKIRRSRNIEYITVDQNRLHYDNIWTKTLKEKVEKYIERP